MSRPSLKALSVCDEEGKFVLDDGYLSFVCEENGNIIRIDPRQFDFLNGSKPITVEIEDVTYNLYFTRVSKESRSTENKDHDNKCLENCLSSSLTEANGNLLTGESQGKNKKEVKYKRWDEESTQLLIKLYKQISPKLVKNRRYHKKNRTWQKISHELKRVGHDYTPLQVITRWKFLCRNGCQVMREKMAAAELLNAHSGIPPVNSERQISNIINQNGGILEYLVKDILQNSSEERKQVKPSKPSELEIGTSNVTINSTWDQKSSNLFVELYDELSPLQGKDRLYKTKYSLYKKICEELKKRGNYHFSTEQVENKWFSLERGLHNKIQKIMTQQPLEKKNFEHTDKGSKVDEDSPALPEKEHSGLSRADYHNMLTSQNTLKDWFDAYCGRGQEWNYKQTLLLVQLYKKHNFRFGGDNSLMYQPKSEIWKAITLDLLARGHKFTVKQVENKWKSMEWSLRDKLLKRTHPRGPGKTNWSTLRCTCLHQEDGNNETVDDPGEESSYFEDDSTMDTRAPLSGEDVFLTHNSSINSSRKSHFISLKRLKTKRFISLSMKVSKYMMRIRTRVL